MFIHTRKFCRSVPNGDVAVLLLLFSSSWLFLNTRNPRAFGRRWAFCRLYCCNRPVVQQIWLIHLKGKHVNGFHAHLLHDGPVSCCLRFTFWHRLAFSALLLTICQHLHPQQLFAIFPRFSICYQKYWWWCVNWCLHKPAEGAGILSAKNNSNNDMEKYKKKYGTFWPKLLRHLRLPKQYQWVRTILLFVVNTVTKNYYFW